MLRYGQHLTFLSVKTWKLLPYFHGVLGWCCFRIKNSGIFCTYTLDTLTFGIVSYILYDNKWLTFYGRNIFISKYNTGQSHIGRKAATCY